MKESTGAATSAGSGASAELGLSPWGVAWFAGTAVYALAVAGWLPVLVYGPLEGAWGWGWPGGGYQPDLAMRWYGQTAAGGLGFALGFAASRMTERWFMASAASSGGAGSGSPPGRG